MNEPWTLGIAEAAALIRAGELSSAALLESVLERVEETEPYARAWVHIDRDGARAAARESDRAVLEGRAGALAGIPIGIKDVINVKGMATEAGSAALHGNIADRDAGAVARLRTNGAVILGKLATHEFAFGQGTPPTRNPWDARRYAGGSSVGSGVAVAVGSAPGALGTDTGGSVRNPAAVNGLVGLKPSAGLVDGSGVFNVSHTLDHIGPVARSVLDCAVLLNGMAIEPVFADDGGGGSGLLRCLEAISKPCRLAIDRKMWTSWGVCPDVEAVAEQAVLTLEQLGFDIVELDLPDIDLSLPASLAISLSEAVQHHRALLAEAAPDYLPETRVMIETGALVRSEDVALAQRVRAYLRDRITETFTRTQTQALLAPTLPAIAPLNTAMAHELTGQTGAGSLASALRMLSPANLTGFPALSVPCGRSGGQPVGLHMMGPIRSDAALLGIAHAYEQSSPWRSLTPLRLLPERPTR